MLLTDDARIAAPGRRKRRMSVVETPVSPYRIFSDPAAEAIEAEPPVDDAVFDQDI